MVQPNLIIKYIWFLKIYKFSWEFFFSIFLILTNLKILFVNFFSKNLVKWNGWISNIFDFYKYTNFLGKLFFQNFWFLQIYKFCLKTFFQKIWWRGMVQPTLIIKYIWFLQIYKLSWETFFFIFFYFHKFTNSVWKLFFSKFLIFTILQILFEIFFPKIWWNGMVEYQTYLIFTNLQIFLRIFFFKIFDFYNVFDFYKLTNFLGKLFFRIFDFLQILFENFFPKIWWNGMVKYQIYLIFTNLQIFLGNFFF